MDKPVISSGALRLGVSISGAALALVSGPVIAAISGVLDDVKLEDVVAGGRAAWFKLIAAIAIAAGGAAGGALWGYAKTWRTDRTVEQVQAEFEGLIEAVQHANNRADAATAALQNATDPKADALPTVA